MATTTHAQTTNGNDHTKQLVSDLQGTHTLPLWEQMAKYNPPAPNPKAIPHLWKYDELKPHLLRAGELITEKQAERRVLMLINPALGKSILDRQKEKLLLCVHLSKYTKLMDIQRRHVQPTPSTPASNSLCQMRLHRRIATPLSQCGLSSKVKAALQPSTVSASQ
jgi:hypothetical protein